MNNLEIGKQLAEICSLLHDDDNTNDEDYWISEGGGDSARGFAQSAIKGKLAHAVFNQNGELLSRPTNRIRTGMWKGEISHLTGLHVTSDGRDATDLFLKHVRALGYTYRQYESFSRIDYIPYDKGGISMIIMPHESVVVTLALTISHRLSWPSSAKGSKYRVSKTGDGLSIISNVSETTVRAGDSTNINFEVNETGVQVTLTLTGDAEIYVSGDGSNISDEDLRNNMDFHSLIKRKSVLKTPDTRLNKLFLWAKHDLLELYSENRIGSGFYAGLPVFSWFFGRDGEWIGQAATEVGLSDLTRDHLELLWKYSRDGRIPHELPLIDDELDYGFEIDGRHVSTRFLSIDSSPLWIINSIHLSNWTDGRYDTERLNTVSDFMKKCDRDNDGFLENRFDDGLIGWVEEWARDRDGVCVDVNAQWVQAQRLLDSIRGIDNRRWQRDLDKYVQTFISTSGGRAVVYDCINGDEKKVTKTPMSLVPVMYFGRDIGNIAESVMEEFSESDMMLPWGIRSVSDMDPMYDDGYHTGMVWPLMTGWTALAAFSAGKTDLGIRLLNSFVTLAYNSADPGRIGEVYSSADMREEGQFFQGWSSGLFIISVVEGLFGLTIDLMGKEDWYDCITPSLPEEWQSMELSYVQKGDSVFNIRVGVNGAEVTETSKSGFRNEEEQRN